MKPRLDRHVNFRRFKYTLIPNLLILVLIFSFSWKWQTRVVVWEDDVFLKTTSTASPKSPLFYHHCVKPSNATTLNWPDRELGTLNRVKPGPLEQPELLEKSLIAIAVGKDSQPILKYMISKLDMTRFDLILFHYDNSDWSEFSWYPEVTSVRALGMTKWWFAKRFLTRQVVEGYKFLFLWDDDVVPSSTFNFTSYSSILENYSIHFSQPAIVANPHYPDILGKVSNGIGRWTTFVEIMAPVFSTQAWIHCAHPMIQGDLVLGWGLDQSWYYVCGGLGWQGKQVSNTSLPQPGYCRMAVLDSEPALHLDKRAMRKNPQPQQHGLPLQRVGELNDEIINQIVKDTCDPEAKNCVGWTGPGHGKIIRELHPLDTLDPTLCLEHHDLWRNIPLK